MFSPKSYFIDTYYGWSSRACREFRGEIQLYSFRSECLEDSIPECHRWLGIPGWSSLFRSKWRAAIDTPAFGFGPTSSRRMRSSVQEESTWSGLVAAAASASREGGWKHVEAGNCSDSGNGF